MLPPLTDAQLARIAKLKAELAERRAWREVWADEMAARKTSRP